MRIAAWGKLGGVPRDQTVLGDNMQTQLVYCCASKWAQSIKRPSVDTSPGLGLGLAGNCNGVELEHKLGSAMMAVQGHHCSILVNTQQANLPV